MEELTYLKAGSCEEAIAFASQARSGFRFVAGGTDVLVNKFQGTEAAESLIDITGIPRLKEIAVDSDFIRIGALVTLENLVRHPWLRDHLRALTQAAASVASPVIRKTATLGGNLLCENRCVFYNQSEWWRKAAGYCLKCNGDVCIATGGKKNCFSKFVSDTAPVLLALGAQIAIQTANGAAELPLEKIYTGDGVNPRCLPALALIQDITIPVQSKFRCAFRKLRPREAVDFSSLTCAVAINNDSIRIVLGGVDPRPVIIEDKISCNREDLVAMAMKKPRIIDNDYYPRLYRKEMIGVFVRQCLHELEEHAC